MTYREVRNAVLFAALVAVLWPVVKCVDGVLWLRTKWDKWRGVALILPLVAMPAMPVKPRPLAVQDRVIVQLSETEWSDVAVITSIEHTPHAGDAIEVDTERRTYFVPWYQVKRVGR